jgi:hypothetical protein
MHVRRALITCAGELWILTVIVTPSRILGILIIENATGEQEMAGTRAIAGFNVQVALRLSCHGAQAAPGGSAQSGAACRGRGRGISRDQCCGLARARAHARTGTQHSRVTPQPGCPVCAAGRARSPGHHGRGSPGEEGRARPARGIPSSGRLPAARRGPVGAALHATRLPRPRIWAEE